MKKHTFGLHKQDPFDLLSNKSQEPFVGLHSKHTLGTFFSLRQISVEVANISVEKSALKE